jgi:hypothetical protein
MIDQHRKHHAYTYILDADGNPAPEPDIMAWAQWHSDPERSRILLDQVGDVEVSTVFRGVDSPSWGMFETMTFSRPGHPWHERQWRNITRAEALKEHRDICAAIRNGHDADNSIWRSW